MEAKINSFIIFGGIIFHLMADKKNSVFHYNGAKKGYAVSFTNRILVGERAWMNHCLWGPWLWAALDSFTGIRVVAQRDES